ncbi:uncharacterized protein P174DRAFT_420046 [Aspergillus novofumigatus IBT 16806]|uniref:Uncharacterized protein n=1 Tax=Aspergillus novofumigatus (strain IBT 16806) TaxID=1392255 RepID=A0A2I1CEZ7_ASPN1|nr:uncharacterized protein P174DRAFT_420046 [Aspergillus novofumigatus IBT 16806]PKX96180.1 hypothetical protein P174DRAFT_420046 [Aspergillus novofumigatus IBT 16806]
MAGTNVTNLPWVTSGKPGKYTGSVIFKTVGIICDLETVFNAVTPLFDQYWDEDGARYGKVSGDQNTSTTGRIDKYNGRPCPPTGYG